LESSHRTFLTHRVRDIAIVAACLLAHGIYLLAAWRGYGEFGFPLDDAWIYQTYARNLAHSGQWAFVPGAPSTGSTSILWTVLLTPLHLIASDPRWGTHILGFVMLAAAALGAARLFDEDPPLTSLLVGLAVALEWHLVWAAASGMETLLFTAMVVWYWVWLRRRDPALVGHRWQDGVVVGLWGGALMLSRPEGVLVFIVTAVYGLLVPGRWIRKFIWLVLASLGFAVVAAPFFGLNVLVSGDIWPNTFSAKQTEYSVLYQTPYAARLLEQISVVMVGAQILLLPGVIYELYRDIRYRTDLVSLVPWVWVLAHLALYAARLPVTYQHGRYAIPVIPIVLVFGVRGMLRLARPRHRRTAIRLVSAAWLASLAVLFPVFLTRLGADAYGRDVLFIEYEMVETAHWVRENIDSEVMLAAHDIGALGYFAPHPLLDLAGLVSPEIVEVGAMDNPSALRIFILESNAEFVVVFPDWSPPSYREMLDDPHFCKEWSTAERPAYISTSNQAPMTIYSVHPDGKCPPG
jgi:hypothetical protein